MPVMGLCDVYLVVSNSLMDSMMVHSIAAVTLVVVRVLAAAVLVHWLLKEWSGSVRSALVVLAVLVV